MELRCEWNSSTRSLFTHTWLSSTYLNHHLGGLGVDERAFSSTCSMTRLAKMALTAWGSHRTTENLLEMVTLEYKEIVVEDEL